MNTQNQQQRFNYCGKLFTFERSDIKSLVMVSACDVGWNLYGGQ